MPAVRVPADYLLQPGDEVAVAVWGSLDGQWTLRVDRAGRFVLPRVGPVAVAGRSQQELPGLLRQRLDTVFRDYQLSAAVSEPGPVAVHLTGFVDQPGERVFAPLTTLAGALARSVGPGSPGSLRRVQLLRDGRPLVAFDLYQLLQTGSRRDDRLLQPGDVIHVEAAGAQVAVVGSVNRPAVFELLPGETVGDALRLAGGLSPVADRGVLLLERMGQRQGRGMRQLQLPRDLGLALEDGDLLQAGAGALVDGPTQRRNKRLRISGEVLRPGDYLLNPDTTLDQALAAAGGTTPAALLYGTALRRDSVRRLQEQNYQRALREMETTLLDDGARSTVDSAEAGLAGHDLLARLRTRQPEGRMVLDLAPDADALPPLPLEDGDQIHVPPRSQTVGVFGSVANPGSFVHQGGRSVADYLQRAGGPRERADADASFVVRANGEVVTPPGRWWRADRLAALPALPGDTVFVPERPLSSRWMQDTKDWTQVLYQLGLGVAALLAVR
jgi:protein involved in polysaccharide export with SLBB domain